MDLGGHLGHNMGRLAEKMELDTYICVDKFFLSDLPQNAHADISKDETDNTPRSILIQEDMLRFLYQVGSRRNVHVAMNGIDHWILPHHAICEGACTRIRTYYAKRDTHFRHGFEYF